MKMIPQSAVVLGIFLLIGVLGTGWAESGTTDSAGESMVNDQRGRASYYSDMAHGERTASGEIFDKDAMMAAHPSLPFGTVVRITDMDEGRSVDVRIVDRGPSEALQQKGVIIILSTAAAKSLGFIDKGTAPVEIEVVQP